MPEVCARMNSAVIPGERRIERCGAREGDPGIQDRLMSETWIPFPRTTLRAVLAGDDN